MIFALLLACSPAFDETRKDLDGFRLVGMAAILDSGGEHTALHALVWSGEGAFHSTAPTIEWSIDGERVARGPAPPFTAHVRVESAVGDVEEGELAVETDAAVPVISGSSRILHGSAAALALEVETDSTTRWMSSRGAFVETGPHAADWTLEEPVEEGEPEPAEPGHVAIVALTLDGSGGNAWTWLDVTTDVGSYVSADGRLLSAEAEIPAAGRYLATLSLSANLAGLVLRDVVAASDGEAGEIVCGLDPFDAAALADGRCGLDEAGGARVAIEATPWP